MEKSREISVLGRKIFMIYIFGESQILEGQTFYRWRFRQYTRQTGSLISIFTHTHTQIIYAFKMVRRVSLCRWGETDNRSKFSAPTAVQKVLINVSHFTVFAFRTLKHFFMLVFF